MVNYTKDQFEYYILSSKEHLKRLKVPGGWLVQVSGYRETSICFYPDPHHAWQIKALIDTSKMCPYCKGTDLREMTEFYKSHCCIQHLIDRSLFCYDCQPEDVKYRLNHPIKNCNECEGTDGCPNSDAALEARKKNYSTGYIRQNDQRDDWPHAIIWQGCDCLNNALTTYSLTS